MNHAQMTLRRESRLPQKMTSPKSLPGSAGSQVILCLLLIIGSLIRIAQTQNVPGPAGQSSSLSSSASSLSSHLLFTCLARSVLLFLFFFVINKIVTKLSAFKQFVNSHSATLTIIVCLYLYHKRTLIHQSLRFRITDFGPVIIRSIIR